ncbi:DUF7133 domain-containing protein [Colwellia piezophila]|uniref:DUF7133 domain-containing protein n=1 Tax=Colwellia piezophila TaxID=211668 RepID=UPI000379A207|nr:c-type cytochrome [Colwellia piezophila]
MPITLTKKLATFSLISVLVTLPVSAKKVQPEFDAELHNKILPMSAEDSLKTMILQDGYRMEIVAAEPLIEEPVTMAFDGNGRIYVAEMLTYMQDAEGTGTFKSISRIKRLEDKDGDGLFESYTIFADNLLLPRMISTLDDGRILIRETNTKDLLLLTDSDGDGVADKRETVYQGGKQGGNLEHQPSGLIYSLDNWMYVARSKQRYKYVDGKVQTQNIHAAGGQWGLAHDKAGRHYFSAAGAQNPVFGFQAPVVYGSVNIAGEQAEGYREVFPISTTPDVQGGVKMLRADNTLNHFTGGGGQSIYVGGLFDDMEGDYIIAEPVGNLIRRSKVVRSEGHTVISNPYQAQRKEFVVSSDANFRPVWTDTAPDGSLMILDMYRGIIQESNWTQKGSYLRGVIDQYGFDKVIGRGRLYRIFKEGVPLYSLPKMFNETPAQLVKHLSHKNRWWRLEAQKLIVLSGDQSVVPALKSIVLENQNSDARIHALWTLEGLGIVDKSLLIKLFDDNDNQLKVQAIRVSEQLIADKDIAAHWAKLANSKDIEVAQQALLSAYYLKTQNRQQILSTVKENHPKSKGFKAIETSINQRAAKKLRLEQLAAGNKEFAKAMIAGEHAFKENCANCHGDDGKGTAMGKDLIAPSFHNNPRVTGNTTLLTNLVTKGLTGEIDGKSYAGVMMPSIASNGAEYVANVLTYIRNKFGNLASMVTAEELANINKLSPQRTAMWTQKELALAFNQEIDNKDLWKVSSNFKASQGKPLKNLHDGTKAMFSSSVNRMAGDAITVELPAAVFLTEIYIDFFKWNKAFSNSSNYQISLSMDGKDWTVLKRDKNLKDFRSTQALGHQAKFIKITNKEDKREWKITEINLFGRTGS